MGKKPGIERQFLKRKSHISKRVKALKARGVSLVALDPENNKLFRQIQQHKKIAANFDDKEQKILSSVDPLQEKYIRQQTRKEELQNRQKIELYLIDPYDLRRYEMCSSSEKFCYETNDFFQN